MQQSESPTRNDVRAENRYVARANAFSRDRATHTYELLSTGLLVKGRSRQIAAELFRPTGAREGLPVALFAGNGLTPAANFYALGPELMERSPHRTFVFVHAPGTGLSGRDVYDLDHLDCARLYAEAIRAAVGDHMVIVGGHAQGGGYAQILARATHRVGIAALVLLDPIPLGGATHVFRRVTQFGWTMNRLVRHVIASPDVSPDFVDFFSWAMHQDRKLCPRAAFATVRGRDFPDRTHPVFTPVLIVGAQASGAIDQTALRSMSASATYPYATYHAIESQPGEVASHFTFLELTRTADLVTRFMAEVEGQSS
jgi:pimeloyl-ACP methyl ester carboxylesterase